MTINFGQNFFPSIEEILNGLIQGQVLDLEDSNFSNSLASTVNLADKMNLWIYIFNLSS